MGKYKAPENDGGQGVRSSQNLFARRGNPWITREEAEQEFATAFTIKRETRVLSRDEEDAVDRCTMYESMRQELLAKGYKIKAANPPSREEITLHHVEQNPDLDRYTKATFAKPKPAGPTPKPMETSAKHNRTVADLRRLAAANLAIRKRTIRVK